MRLFIRFGFVKEVGWVPEKMCLRMRGFREAEMARLISFVVWSRSKMAWGQRGLATPIDVRESTAIEHYCNSDATEDGETR